MAVLGHSMKRGERDKRFKALRYIGCLACETNGKSGIAQVPLWWPMKVEIHHQNTDGKAGQRRLGDEFTVPLCGWHHRGVHLTNFTRKMMTLNFGPSLASESKRFRTMYGTDLEMLARANKLIEKHDTHFMEDAA